MFKRRFKGRINEFLHDIHGLDMLEDIYDMNCSVLGDEFVCGRFDETYTRTIFYETVLGTAWGNLCF